MDNVIFLILLIVFLGLIFVFVSGQNENVGIAEQQYASEIARVINLAEPGDEIILDVHNATRLALEEGIEFNKIFSFDNENNKVFVKLSSSGRTSFEFFNDVDVVDSEIEIGLKDGVNKLKFRIVSGGVG